MTERQPVTRVEPYRDAQAATFIGRTYRNKNSGSVFVFNTVGRDDPFDCKVAQMFLDGYEWVTITKAPNGDAIITVDGPCGNVVEVAE